ncbi:MAG: hypothetical protein LBV54_01380 [Puniceicoccales bacterium]|jgi:hypothetical protein|nr:hypothetical protein [Puniceicoccales bacterium]
MPRLFSHFAARRPAFTLIEVLTATAITVFIVLAVLFVTTETFRAYDGAIAKLDTITQARAALVPLQQDLESAIIRNDGRVWMQVDHLLDTGNVKKGQAPVLMLFAPVPDRLKRIKEKTDLLPGDVCAIKYRIAQRSPFLPPGEKGSKESMYLQTYGFYRAIVDAKETFDVALEGIVEGNRDPLDFWQGSAEVIDSDGNRHAQSLEEWATGAQNYIASNVVGVTLIFWFLEYGEDENAKPQLKAFVHMDNMASAQTAFQSAGIDVVVEAYNRGLKIKSGQIIVDDNVSESKKRVLKSVDVSLVILSPSGAKELRGLQYTEGTVKVRQDKYDKLLEKQGEHFTAKIRFYQ